MTLTFNAQKGLIIVPVELTGPSGAVAVRPALDTGATSSLINVAPLVLIGYDPAMVPRRVQVTTGSGVEFVPQVSIAKISAFGQDFHAFPMLCHTLPPTATIDGLLGLDFFRGRILTLNFQIGEMTLA
jgi:hypothetical protein